MRDELVVERKQVGVGKDGNPICERFRLQFGPTASALIWQLAAGLPLRVIPIIAATVTG
jgi:hypothetical protein